jgi:hypothetical protein
LSFALIGAIRGLYAVFEMIHTDYPTGFTGFTADVPVGRQGGIDLYGLWRQLSFPEFISSSENGPPPHCADA